MIYVSKQLEKATVDLSTFQVEIPLKEEALCLQVEQHQHHICMPVKKIKNMFQYQLPLFLGINEPWVADELIANGKTDICMIGRPNLCDSEFANKAKAGKQMKLDHVLVVEDV